MLNPRMSAEEGKERDRDKAVKPHTPPVFHGPRPVAHTLIVAADLLDYMNCENL